MKKITAFCAFLALILAIGCGGGGGSGSGSGTGGGNPVTIVGRVIDVATGAPPATKPSIQSSTQTVQAAADGSFSVSAPSGATQILVDSLTADGTFTYTFPPASGTVDLGDLWIGPQKITLTGRIVDSTNGVPVSGAVVTFAGRQVSTAANGTFSIPQVAYSSASQAAFLGIVGSVNSSSYFLLNFTAAGSSVAGGVLSIGDLLITPSNDPNPPGTPYSITGVVKPLGTSAGTVVTLKQGGTAVRIFNVGSDGRYYFWVDPGTYTVSYAKQALTAPTQTVTVHNLGETDTVPDVTLH